MGWAKLLFATAHFKVYKRDRPTVSPKGIELVKSLIEEQHLTQIHFLGS